MQDAKTIMLTEEEIRLVRQAILRVADTAPEDSRRQDVAFQVLDKLEW